MMRRGENLKKLLCYVLLFIMLLSVFSCCSPNGSSDAAQKDIDESPNNDEVASQASDDYASPEEFTLPIAINDSLNPYTAQSKQNKQLSGLIYESLVTLDNDFQPKYQLASLISGGKTEYTVLLRSGAKFSNGKNVTASDVVYSYNVAAKTDEYKGVFDNISAVGQVNGDVVFVLKEADPYFINLLTFPIIPYESKDKKDSNGRITSPVGSGRYVYSYTATERTLVSNKYYNGSGTPSVKEIKLIDTPDNEALAYYAKTGKISLCYTDFSHEDYLRVDGNSTTVNLNNIIYLGVNSKDKNLSQPEVRRAVSFAVDREELCGKIFYQASSPANGLYNPAFKSIDITDDKFYLRQVEAAVEELKEIGYNNSSGDGVMRKGDLELSLRLLVNEDNSARVQAAEQIANNLREVGFKITVEKRSFKEYSQMVAALDYDLYVGEVKINNNMDLSPLLDNSNVSAGGTDETAGENYKKFRSGEMSAENFKKYFEKEMPVIPLLYRKGMITYSRYLGGDITPAASDIFYGIEAWTYKITE